MAKTGKSVNLVQRPIRKFAPVFILPTFLAFVIGFAWPFLQGIYLSFCNFNTPKDTRWVGIGNYLKVFADAGFLNAYGTVDLGATMAIIMLSIIPIILVYIFCQKHIIKGVAAGAVKG